ncbi:ABC transporter permease [Paenibacillus macquariensis]|uniref:Carbohydrate ABC transporter membrane protein 1, CUT1 family n=2 Tax=Paenibacillus macquariensis TaxID=948756 RepID=A0ABY1JVJ5_9BACL|nr:ABC transporter permease subunit [Paenibacillus macquariensis]MEC0090732.1 ABC transporter permease subunit [Paenibacillus macquariensis]SIQ85121.1 carbohydrate ABC transporter membrane protein 1, CUT1 family [Paenibacillus macquariensis]
MLKKGFKRQLPLHLMLLPGIVLVFIYCYIPMVGGIMAFQKFIPSKGLFHSKWVGLKNFEYLFSMPDFYQVLWNTVFIAILKIIFGLIVPITIAILLNEVGKSVVKRWVQTLIYLPHFLSWVILGGVLIDILSPSYGLLNQFLGIFSIKPIFFLGDNQWFPFTIVLSDVWKEFGFSTIVYLAALTAVNPSLYEAAVIDGANRWKQTWNITIPGILPIIVLMTTLSLGNVLNAGFDQVFNLYSPLVYESGDILDTLIYRIGLIDGQYGVATALGLFKSLISFALVSISYWLAYKIADYRIF